MPTKQILVIEEEVLLALDIEDILTEAGFGSVTHYRHTTDAVPHLGDLSGVALAVVEARLGAPEVVAFTERLGEAGVAVVVMSADHAATQAFPHAVPLGKPFAAAALIAACRSALARVS